MNKNIGRLSASQYILLLFIKNEFVIATHRRATITIILDNSYRGAAPSREKEVELK